MRNFWIILLLLGISFNCWVYLLPSNYILTLHQDQGRIIQVESNFWRQVIRYGSIEKTKSVWSDFYWEKAKPIPSNLYFTANNLPSKISASLIINQHDRSPSNCWDGEYVWSSLVTSKGSYQLDLRCNGDSIKKEINNLIKGTFNEEEIRMINNF